MDVKLVTFKPNGERKDFPLDNPAVALGRGEGCDLRVPILSVSRRHCELTVADDQVIARDLGSANGTYVNNERIEEIPLKAGDRLAIGPVIFTVEIDGLPTDIQPIAPRPEQAAEDSADAIIGLKEDSGEIGFGHVPTPQQADQPEAPQGSEETFDPIAALEALATEGGDDEDEELNK